MSETTQETRVDPKLLEEKWILFLDQIDKLPESVKPREDLIQTDRTTTNEEGSPASLSNIYFFKEALPDGFKPIDLLSLSPGLRNKLVERGINSVSQLDFVIGELGAVAGDNVRKDVLGKINGLRNLLTKGGKVDFDDLDRQNREALQAGNIPPHILDPRLTKQYELYGFNELKLLDTPDDFRNPFMRAGYTTISSVDTASDDTLRSVRQVGPQVVREIRKGINPVRERLHLPLKDLPK